MGGTIGRLFIPIEGESSKLNESLKQAMDAAEKAGVKITQAGQRIIASFDQALNPTKALSEQIRLLELAGRSAGDIMAVMGKKIEDATKTATSNGQAIDATVQKYVDLGKQGSKSGISIEGLGKTLSDFARNPMEAAKAGISGFIEKLGPAAVGVSAMGAAVVAAGVGIFKMAADAGEAAEALINLSASTGLSLKELQVFNQISKEMGLGTEGVTRAIEKLQEQLGKPEGGDFTNALAAYNIALKDNSGSTRPVIDLLDDFRTKLIAIEDPQRQAQVMMAALGGRSRELSRLLLAGGASLAEWKKALEDAGVIQTEAAIKKAAEFDTKLDELGRRWTSLANTFKEGAVDIATAIFKAFDTESSGVAARAAMEGWGFQADPAESGVTPAAAGAGAGGVPAGAGATDPDAIKKRGEEIARLKALQTGASRELAAALADLGKAQEAFRNLEKSGSLESLQEQNQIIIAIKKRIDSIEAAKKAEIERITDISKGTFDMSELDRIAGAASLEMRKAIETDDLKRAARIAGFLGQIKDQIAAEKDLAEVKKIQADIDRTGHAALVPGGTEVAAGLKKLDADAKKRLQEFGQIEADIGKQITSSDLEQLRIQEQILGTITPIGDAQRVQFALEKIHLQAANREEEIRIKFTQTRKDLLEKIAKIGDPLDPLRIKALQDLEALNGKMDEQLKGVGSLEAAEALKVHRDEYNKMIESVRDGAGKVFDAMVSRGKGAFTNLKDWIEGVFLTRLRTLFENLMESIFTPGSGGSLLSKLLKGVLPNFGGSGATSMGPSTGDWAGEVGPGVKAAGSFAGLGAMAAFGVPAAGFAASMSQNPYIKGAGFAGMGLGGASAILAATSGVGMAGMGTAMMALLSNPITAAILGGIVAGFAGYKLAKGKNSWEAGGMEASRDFGVDVSKKDFQSWSQGLGLNESKTYGIRKDLESSPLFLTQVALPAAKAQGSMDAFLKSLEAVKTSWGTFDFRKAFELGNLTGDWTELDKVFKDSFKDSKALQENMPNWEEVLLVNGKAAETAAADFEALYKEFAKTGEVTDAFQTFLEDNATLLDVAGKKSALLADQILQVNAALANKPTLDGLLALKTALEADTGASDKLYAEFYKTGEITDVFAAKIVELGGDLSKFEEASRLAAISKEFDDLAATFRSTGEILPRLRDLFKEFGGDLKALDDASILPGLQDGLDSLNDFSAGLQRLLDVMSPVQQVLAGEWGADTWAGLFDMGLDPSKLTRITDLIKETKAWEAERAEFEKTGKLKKGGTLEQSLSQFGGAAGTHALEQYAKGYNIITPDLLDKTKAALDKAYHDELKTALAYIGTIEKQTSDQIDALNATVETQLKLVGANITSALELSKTAVIDQLGLMLDTLKEIALNTGSGSSLPGPGTIAVPSISVTIAGDVYGVDKLEHRVTDAVDSALRKGWRPVTDRMSR